MAGWFSFFGADARALVCLVDFGEPDWSLLGERGRTSDAEPADLVVRMLRKWGEEWVKVLV